MEVMLIFYVVIMVFGVYMIASAFKMKRTGEISSTVITEQEMAKCKNKQEFIDFIYWKEAVFGVVLIFVGGLGIINDMVVSLGVFNIVELVLFLVAFTIFQNALRKAREQFL